MPTNTLDDFQKSLAKMANSIISAVNLEYIYTLIHDILDELQNSITEVTAYLQDLLNKTELEITNILDKLGALDIMKEVSSSVSNLVTSITGMTACVSMALFSDSEMDISNSLGYLDPHKKVLYDSIKPQVINGASFKDIYVNSKETIKIELDVANKMQNASLTFLS